MWQGWGRPYFYWSLACRIWRRSIGGRLGSKTPCVIMSDPSKCRYVCLYKHVHKTAEATCTLSKLFYIKPIHFYIIFSFPCDTRNSRRPSGSPVPPAGEDCQQVSLSSLRIEAPDGPPSIFCPSGFLLCRPRHPKKYRPTHCPLSGALRPFRVRSL